MMASTDKASHIAHDTVDKIAHAAQQVEDTLNEKGDQLKNAEKELMDNCRGYVRDNPITTIGIAVAAGFLLSRLLSGR